MEFETVRFNELKRYLKTISDKTLSTNLKELEADKLIVGGRQYFMGSERNLHKQGNAAQDNSQRNIKVPADAIPQVAAGLPAAGIDG